MTLLTKLFCPSKTKHSTHEGPKALRVMHAGGLVDCYYMAVSAAVMMEKYPRCVLARPEVFHKPWDSIVRPEEILKPGDKIYVMPRSTIRKLKKRIKRTRESEHDLLNSDRRLPRRKQCTSSQLSDVKLQGKKKVRFVSIDEVSAFVEPGLTDMEQEFSFSTGLLV